MNKRDYNLDVMRGGAILYVIFVIHTISCFGFVNIYSIIFSLLLFEMPIIFFISGAALKLSTKKKFRTFLLSKGLRIVVPYLVYAFFSIPYLLMYGMPSDFLNVIYLDNLNLPYCWHLWFIMPYLLISVLGYFLIRIYHKWGVRFVCFYVMFISISIFIFDLLAFLKFDILREVLVYSIFYVMGFTYREKITYLCEKTSILVLLYVVLYFLLINSDLYSSVTQINKFPPNFAYVIWGIIVSLLTSLFLNKVKLPRSLLLERANKYGFELYLYQNYAFFIVAIIFSYLGLSHNSLLKYLLLVVFIATFIFPIAKVAYRINTKIASFFKKT